MHIKEHAANFKRFGAVWTPTVLIMDSDGQERRRLEGYLPRNEFQAWLTLGLARLAFLKKDFGDAEKRFGEVAAAENSKFAPEAIYYTGVSKYSASHDHNVLGDTAKQLQDIYPGNEWQLRSIPWLPATEAAAT